MFQNKFCQSTEPYFLTYHNLTNVVRVIKGKIWRFELSRVRVTEGKITVNV